MNIQLQRLRSEEEDEASELAPYRIAAYPADYTLEVLHEKWKQQNISIPPFQRQYVWTLVQASRLIESFLLGLPVPGIFFYTEKETGQLMVIDGQQRLRSVFSYFDGELPGAKRPFRLRQVQPRWDGKGFANLTRSEQQGLFNSVLRATIVDQLDPTDNTSIFHIFERLNTGGTSLRPQEVRNCIYSGPFNDFLIELNRGKDWRLIIGSDQIDKRMRDVELILRLLALVESRDHYSTPMKNFLSVFMSGKRCLDKKQQLKLATLFTDTTAAVVGALGRKPFHVYTGLNAAAFDGVMTAFATTGRNTPSNVKTRYQALLDNESFKEYISHHTTDVEVVKSRLALARKTLFGD